MSQDNIVILAALSSVYQGRKQANYLSKASPGPASSDSFMPNEVHCLNIAGYLFVNCVRLINSALQRAKHSQWYNQLIIHYKIR